MIFKDEELKNKQIAITGKDYYFYQEFKQTEYTPDIQIFSSPQSVHNVISSIFWLDEEGMEGEYLNVLADIANNREDNLISSNINIGGCFCNLFNLIASVQLLVEERDLLKKKLEAR